MGRWNGWGIEGEDYPLESNSLKFLKDALGEAQYLGEISLEHAISLLHEPKRKADQFTRLVHSYGQSFVYNKGCVLIPYGVGTSVLGHLTPPDTEVPVICVDIKCFNRVIEVDEVSHTANIENVAQRPFQAAIPQKHLVESRIWS